MRVFKYKGFSRYTKKEGIIDAELLEVVSQLNENQADVDLGGDVYKVRLARPGEGKAGGYRIIVYFKNEFRTFFVYGFSKSRQDNIDEGELRAFKIDARENFALTEAQINAWIKRGTLIEVPMEDRNEIQK